MFTLLLIVIGIALLFDLVNGFHDAANSIATVVSTKVLTPFQAVLWAAMFNIIAFWVFDMSVGNTVAKTVDNNAIDLWVILAGLLAATHLVVGYPIFIFTYAHRWFCWCGSCSRRFWCD
jgi:PiT family inorganic phosphate transporter